MSELVHELCPMFLRAFILLEKLLGKGLAELFQGHRIFGQNLKKEDIHNIIMW